GTLVAVVKRGETWSARAAWDWGQAKARQFPLPCESPYRLSLHLNLSSTKQVPKTVMKTCYLRYHLSALYGGLPQIFLFKEVIYPQASSPRDSGGFLSSSGHGMEITGEVWG
ncbi:UNVERIFIED_CONTAM: hypothetical protein K2H54_077288, partial [Gekko kuhli]